MSFGAKLTDRAGRFARPLPAGRSAGGVLAARSRHVVLLQGRSGRQTRESAPSLEMAQGKRARSTTLSHRMNSAIPHKWGCGAAKAQIIVLKAGRRRGGWPHNCGA